VSDGGSDSDRLDGAVSVAVLLPCLDEEPTIGKVVGDFRRALPAAAIYVYDNGSTDRTAEVARASGAIVRRSPTRGKGNVVRRMFAEVDATVYVLADGDDTYAAADAPALIRRLRRDQLDMVVGRRVERREAADAYRWGHRLGNRFLTGSVRSLFGSGPEDVLSGYRVFSRRYVKSFPAASRGFEVEAEMTIHALELCLPFDELPTPYVARPEDSSSKLRTIPDGLRIFRLIIGLFKDFRPLRFFGCLAIVAALLAAAAGLLAGHRLDPWTPAALLVVGLCEFVLVLPLIGVILDGLSRGRRETKRLHYLAALTGVRQDGSPDALPDVAVGANGGWSAPDRAA
jgi:glycosyltransferase involved in cell wall biosynthesis